MRTESEEIELQLVRRDLITAEKKINKIENTLEEIGRVLSNMTIVLKPMVEHYKKERDKKKYDSEEILYG